MQRLHRAAAADEDRAPLVRAPRDRAADHLQEHDGALNTLPEYEERRGNPQRGQHDEDLLPGGVRDEREQREGGPQALARQPGERAQQALQRRRVLGRHGALLGDEREGGGEGAAQRGEGRLVRAALARREGEFRGGAQQAVLGRAGRHGGSVRTGARAALRRI